MYTWAATGTSIKWPNGFKVRCVLCSEVLYSAESGSNQQGLPVAFLQPPTSRPILTSDPLHQPAISAAHHIIIFSSSFFGTTLRKTPWRCGKRDWLTVSTSNRSFSLSKRAERNVKRIAASTLRDTNFEIQPVKSFSRDLLTASRPPGPSPLFYFIQLLSRWYTERL